MADPDISSIGRFSSPQIPVQGPKAKPKNKESEEGTKVQGFEPNLVEKAKDGLNLAVANVHVDPPSQGYSQVFPTTAQIIAGNPKFTLNLPMGQQPASAPPIINRLGGDTHLDLSGLNSTASTSHAEASMPRPQLYDKLADRYGMNVQNKPLQNSMELITKLSEGITNVISNFDKKDVGQWSNLKDQLKGLQDQVNHLKLNCENLNFQYQRYLANQAKVLGPNQTINEANDSQTIKEYVEQNKYLAQALNVIAGQLDSLLNQVASKTIGNTWKSQVNIFDKQSKMQYCENFGKTLIKELNDKKKAGGGKAEGAKEEKQIGKEEMQELKQQITKALTNMSIIAGDLCTAKSYLAVTTNPELQTAWLTSGREFCQNPNNETAEAFIRANNNLIEHTWNNQENEMSSFTSQTGVDNTEKSEKKDKKKMGEIKDKKAASEEKKSEAKATFFKTSGYVEGLDDKKVKKDDFVNEANKLLAPKMQPLLDASVNKYKTTHKHNNPNQ